MKTFLLPRVALFALVVSVFLQPPAHAQEPGSSAWKQVQAKPNTWPAQVTLKADVQLTIMHDGKRAGMISAPADSTVQLLSVDDSALRIGVGSAQGSVAPDQTDFEERLAIAAASTTGTTNSTPARNAQPLDTKTNAPPAPAKPPAAAAATTPNAATPPATGAPLQFDYEATERVGYNKAAFHFWSPAYSQPLRGLIIMTPGTDGDGRGMTNDAGWQALARKYGFGLVGNFFQGGDYESPGRGSGNALQDALKNFATQSGHLELTTIPLLLWGISAGGEFNYNYVLWKPQLVMAFVVNKGGYYDEGLADSDARAIPGLFFLGQADADYRIKGITSIWTEGRKRGALWALAPQPGSGHEFSKTNPLARIFFEAILKARLADISGLSPDVTGAPLMKPMQENPGWLGNLTTHDIHDDSTDTDLDRTAAWLPDQSTAQAWKVFVCGG